MRAQEVCMRIHTTPITIFAASLLLACGPKPSEPAPAEPTPSPVTEQKPATDQAAPTPMALELPPIPAGAKVAFIEPLDGATVSGPLENGKVAVPVKMGAEGIAVKPAGPVEAGSGHHHILVDVEPGAAGAVVPADDQHIHFGKAQTEATIWLTPGQHRLALQFADGIHRAYGPTLTTTIGISVVAAGTVGEGATKAATDKGANPAKPASKTADPHKH
jgi:hypothetical protein